MWTNRAGAEYIWFNNVETKPGIGYPKRWEDQSRWKGGWTLKDGKPVPAAGGRAGKLARIFHNPDLPQIDDYYEPWTYNYENLITSPSRKHQPSLRPKSAITGDNMRVKWGPNWEDDPAGVCTTGKDDVHFRGLESEVLLQFKNVFMLHLPRICEHCLNASCVASCPSGALYKRDEDGIVLVDQERCRGWRFCVSGCPYKKVYFNWKTGRSEKCIFCYPRTEAGMPTLCAETCVGKIRYIGVLLYDAEKIFSAASTRTTVTFTPHRWTCSSTITTGSCRRAERSGISRSFIDAARFLGYKLAVDGKLAFLRIPSRTLRWSGSSTAEPLTERWTIRAKPPHSTH